MRVLVTAASKHGGTAEIAVSIAASLEDAGHHASVARPEEILSLDGYEAVILGSAVYAGHWLEEARGFVKRHYAALKEMPVWIFSSGPIGEPLKPETEPVDVSAVRTETLARTHRLFGGRLDRHVLGFGERAVVIALRAPEGDFRPWPAIDAWSREIALELDKAAEAKVDTEPTALPVS